MRIEPGQARTGEVGGGGQPGRGAGFSRALERAGRGRDEAATERAPRGAGRPDRPSPVREQRDPTRGGEPADPGVPCRSLDALLGGLAPPGRSEALARAAGAPLLARAVEQVALVVRSGEAASVTMQLGPSLHVRIGQAAGGVEVQLEAPRGLSPLAEAELPALVASLRERGIRVARARVSAQRRERPPSLTSRRGSATRHGDDGTVAKW